MYGVDHGVHTFRMYGPEHCDSIIAQSSFIL